MGVRGLHTGCLSPKAYKLLRAERQSARPAASGEVEHTVELRARQLARGPRASERRAAHSLLHRYSQSRPPPFRPGGGGCGSQCRRGPLGSHARQVSDELLRCLVPAPAYLGAEHEEPLRASGAELWVGGSLAPLCNPQHGTIVRHGAGLWLARSGQRRHKGQRPGHTGVPRAGWEAAVCGCLQPACVSQQLVQSGRVTSRTELSGGRKLKERNCEGSLRVNRADATPAVHPSGLSSAAHGGRGAGCAGLSLCEKSKECRDFLTPTPSCFTVSRPKKTIKAAAAGTELLRIRVPPLALCRAGERNSRLRIDCGLWRAVVREWGDECRINREQSSMPEGQAIAPDLNLPGVAEKHITVHVSDTNVARDSCAGFAAEAGEGMLERKRPSRKDTGGGTGGSVVPQKGRGFGRSGMCGGRAPGQDAADEATEPGTVAGDSDIVGGGEDRKHTAGMWAGLGEQQSTRRWRNVNKMCLECALCHRLG